jgi:hypothetical protein
VTSWQRYTARLVVSLLGVLSLGAIRSHHHQRARQQMLEVLMGHFETVFAADAGLASGNETPREVPGEIARALSAPFAVVQYGVSNLGPSAATRIWHDTTWVLTGASDFQPPAGPGGIGDVRSRSTTVFLLKHAGALTTFAGGASAVLKRTTDGAWTWSAPPSEGHPTSFEFVATEVKGPFLVISDNPRDCRSVADDLARRDPKPVIPEGVDATAFSKDRLFGYRRYTHTEANRDAAGMSVVSDDAMALQFTFDGKAPQGELELLGRSSQTADRINALRLLPTLKMSTPGRWRTTIHFDRDADTLEEIFAVLSLFGFGVYV